MGFETAVNKGLSRPSSFALKGVLLPMTLLDLRESDLTLVERELAEKVKVAPGFFTGSPVALNVEGLDGVDFELLKGLIDICARLGFRLTALKGDGELVEQFAADLRLGHYPAGKVRQVSEAESGKSHTAARSVAPPSAKVVTAPVRSGQQIFSPADLIVLAPVSAGAELLAVGNIHVYAPLRGRALAGVQGDEAVRIFCQRQEAELVSIAGHFMIDEILRASAWGESAQVYFDGDELRVESLAAI